MFGIFLCWFIILPGMNVFLSEIFLRSENKAWKAMVSLVSFYSFMVFMIYKHYQSDLFQIIMLSLVWSLFILVLLTFAQWRDKHSVRGRDIHR